MRGFSKTQSILGIDFLDEKLQIDRPSMILIEQDQNLNHKIFEKLFIAQSYENRNMNESIFSRSKPFLIPKKTEYVPKKLNQMKIAWRYNSHTEKKKTGFDFLESTESAECIKFGQDREIADFTLISELGAPHDPITEKDLFDLKKRVIQSNSVLVATCPTYLFRDKKFNFNLYFDIVLSLESEHAEENGYHGLLRIKKFKKKPDTLIFGYKITRYGVEMETFEIAPIQETKRIGNELVF
ncbi:putative Elongator complex protein 4 protein [Pseudoloma neurophilia]|uniref:Putative Elongator complex protein 4 protein n=1 Tax=Pseudoloma neurophilia TaxID=146866 RepID=A0A0R0LZI1_9MICR|nr:putative Elongator complex protein 4 protein [Pseudoloma neurophilia]